MLRHDTLIVSASAEDAARGRLLDALAGRGTQSSIALGALLSRLELLEEIVGRRCDARRLQVRTLAPAAQALLTVLADQRRREAVLA